MRAYANLKTLLALPRNERRKKLGRALSRRARTTLNHFVFSYFAPRLNHSRIFPYLLSYRPDSHIEFDGIPKYAQFLEWWLRGNTLNNSGDMARFYALYQNVRHVLSTGVPGDLVELGVYKGNSAAMLAALGREWGRRTFLFDTFTGFDARDLKGIDSNQHVQFTETSLEAVQRLVGTDSVTYVKGFFPQSLDQIEIPQPIAVVHIDCDLYDPMKAGLEIFYPRMSPGGLLMLHDYSSGHWPGATRAIDEFFENRPEKPVLLPGKSGTAVVRKI
jgi:Macrocin-O-methyltransferase (TylF)